MHAISQTLKLEIISGKHFYFPPRAVARVGAERGARCGAGAEGGSDSRLCCGAEGAHRRGGRGGRGATGLGAAELVPREPVGTSWSPAKSGGPVGANCGKLLEAAGSLLWALLQGRCRVWGFPPRQRLEAGARDRFRAAVVKNRFLRW